jgi:hypothetical protein
MIGLQGQYGDGKTGAYFLFIHPHNFFVLWEQKEIILVSCRSISHQSPARCRIRTKIPSLSAKFKPNSIAFVLILVFHFTRIFKEESSYGD